MIFICFIYCRLPNISYFSMYKSFNYILFEMTNENRAKRRRSVSDFRSPAKSVQSMDDSIPVGADCLSYNPNLQNKENQPRQNITPFGATVGPSTSQAHQLSNSVHGRPHSARKLTFAPPNAKESRCDPPDETDTKIEPIVKGMADELSRVFNEVSSSFDRLHNIRVTYSEFTNKFALLPIEQRVDSIKNYPDDYCRELLEAEMLNNKQLEEKVKLLTKRNCDLEKRLGFLETHVERVQKEALDKAEESVSTLISRFAIQEANLLAAREREAQTASALRMSNKSLETARASLEDVVKRQEMELTRTREELQRVEGELKTCKTQSGTLSSQLEKCMQREQGLSTSLTSEETAHQRTREELRKTITELNEKDKELRRIIAETQTVSERYRQEALTHRRDLQREWDELKTNLEAKHRQELGQLEKHIEQVSCELDDVRHRMEVERNRADQLEHEREMFRKQTSEELYRKMMMNYRELVQEFHSEEPSTNRPAMQSRRELAQLTAPLDKENRRQQLHERPQIQDRHAERKQRLTEVLSKAVNKIDKRK